MKDFLLSEMKKECSQHPTCFKCPCYEVCLAFDRKDSPASFHIEYPRKVITRMEVENVSIQM